jgi:hypothetical protein
MQRGGDEALRRPPDTGNARWMTLRPGWAERDPVERNRL